MPRREKIGVALAITGLVCGAISLLLGAPLGFALIIFYLNGVAITVAIRRWREN